MRNFKKIVLFFELCHCSLTKSFTFDYNLINVTFLQKSDKKNYKKNKNFILKIQRKQDSHTNHKKWKLIYS